MKVTSFSLGPLGTNCYIVSEAEKCLIFDPSGNPEVITKHLETHRLKPLAILLTHAHFDHIGALDDLRKQYDLPVYLHSSEKEWLTDPLLNRSELYFGRENAISSDLPEETLTEGKLTIGPFTMKVIHTPGHSPGSMTFIFADQEFIISGDVLFPQGIGRTDLLGGNFEQLKDSILKKLYQLPNEYAVLPGHNVTTTIGKEKETNPYTLQF